MTLALGIGACTAIFSLVNAVMLRSLPYGDSSRLVYLYLPNPNLKEIPPESIGPSNADFLDIKAPRSSTTSHRTFATACARSAASPHSPSSPGAITLL